LKLKLKIVSKNFNELRRYQDVTLLKFSISQ